MVVDLRNFTSHLNASRPGDGEANEFLHFLGRFYGVCLDVALLALPPADRDDPPLYISSTGDGMIAVFTDPTWHFAHGFLASLVLHAVLDRTCARYNLTVPAGAPEAGFGIGVESGLVSRVRAVPRAHPERPTVDTYIGECINVASRAQDLSKQLARARTIVSEQANALLCRELFGQEYAQLMEQASAASVGDGARIALHNRMNELNRSLCLAFIHVHRLRGVPAPVPLFRVSESAARLGNARFEGLLSRLVREDPEHLGEVVAVLAG